MMRATRYKILELTSAAIVVGSIFGFAAAQEGDSGQAVNSGAKEEAVEGSLSKGEVPPDQILLFAQDVIAEAERLSFDVQNRLTEARSEADPDIIRIPCLNSVLSEINARLGSADGGDESSARGRLDVLKQAVESGDKDRVKAEFLMFKALRQRFLGQNGLRSKADRCVGKDSYETGASRVVTTVQEGNPSEDPSSLAVPPTPLGIPVTPPPASPIL